MLDLALARPATLGPARLICVDGPGGSGKTTLAAALADLGAGPVVHMDELYDGWGGLHAVDAQLAALLRPLAAGRQGHYRRYDWHAARYAQTVTVAPSDLGTAGVLVVEGVGSGAASVADLATVTAWIEVPRSLRLARGIARDGEHLRKQWEAWQDAEDAHLAREGTRARADVVLDGSV